MDAWGIPFEDDRWGREVDALPDTQRKKKKGDTVNYVYASCGLKRPPARIADVKKPPAVLARGLNHLLTTRRTHRVQLSLLFGDELLEVFGMHRVGSLRRLIVILFRR